MGESVQITEGVITDSDGNKDGLKFANSVSIGDVTLTSQPGAVDSLLLSGPLLSSHDALYAFTTDMVTDGARDDEGGQDIGFPRIGLNDAVVRRVKWMWAIPAEWAAVDVRFAWSRNGGLSATSVNFGFWYGLFYPFASPLVDTLVGTTVAMAPITVPSTDGAMTYSLPSELVGLPIADGAFGSKPFMVCSLSRDGVADTFAGSAQIECATLTRTA